MSYHYTPIKMVKILKKETEMTKRFVWQFTSVIPATREVEIRKIMV
jgi:hypothetical protein